MNLSFLNLTIIGYALAAGGIFFDKFVLTKSIKHPAVYAFYSTAVMAPLLVLPFFSGHNAFALGHRVLFICLLSGLVFGLALLFLYKGLKLGEASHLNPFAGAMTAIFTWGISSFFLGEIIDSQAKLGIILLLTSSLILSFERRADGIYLHRGYLFAAVSGLLFAFSHVTAKIAYESADFLSVLGWSKGLSALLAIPLFFKYKNLIQTKPKKEKKTKQNSPWIMATLGKIFAAGSVFFIQKAIATGSVTIVNALAGLQFVFLFFLIIISNAFTPKLLSEYMTRRELAIELLAILVALAGAALLA